MTINLRAQFLELLSKYNYFISCFKNIIQRIGIYAYAILFIQIRKIYYTYITICIIITHKYCYICN